MKNISSYHTHRAAIAWAYSSALHARTEERGSTPGSPGIVPNLSIGELVNSLSQKNMTRGATFWKDSHGILHVESAHSGEDALRIILPFASPERMPVPQPKDRFNLRRIFTTPFTVAL